MFFNIVYYKFFKLIKRLSKGSDDHCAYHALLFTLLLFISNLIVFYFVVAVMLSFSLTNAELRAGLLFFLPIFLGSFYYVIIAKAKWKDINSKVAFSSFKGRKGNLLVIGYILFSLLVILGVVFCFIYKNSHVLSI